MNAVILDIDSTLLYTTTDKIESDIEPHHIIVNNINANVYMRPYMREFIMYLAYNYDYIIIWSAGTYEYVHRVVDIIFDGTGKRPHFIFTRDDCKVLRNPTYYMKDIVWLINMLNDKYTANIDINEVRFIEDDVKAKSLFPNNTIIVPIYKPTTHDEIVDDHSLIELVHL